MVAGSTSPLAAPAGAGNRSRGPAASASARAPRQLPAAVQAAGRETAGGRGLVCSSSGAG